MSTTNAINMANKMKTEIIPGDLITPIEAGKLLKTSPATIRRWCQRGTMPAFKVGGRLRISRADALAMLRRVETPGPRIETLAEVEAREAEVDRVLREAGVRR